MALKSVVTLSICQSLRRCSTSSALDIAGRDEFGALIKPQRRHVVIIAHGAGADECHAHRTGRDQFARHALAGRQAASAETLK